MEDTAEALAEEPQDISAMRTATWDRKMANTTTSISFGTDKLNYVSDAMSVQVCVTKATYLSNELDLYEIIFLPSIVSSTPRFRPHCSA
jgi:hypothetical protein